MQLFATQPIFKLGLMNGLIVCKLKHTGRSPSVPIHYVHVFFFILKIFRRIGTTPTNGVTEMCSDCKVYKQSYVSGITSAFRQVREQGGLRPFFRGCLARVVVLAPGCALSWLAYEFMKTCLGAQNSQQRKSDKG